MPSLSRAAITALAAVFCAASLILHLPGHLGYDGIIVWYEARHAVHFSQHPPAMALLLRLADLLVPGPSLYVALQIAVFWACAWILTDWWRPRPVRALLFFATLLAWPVVFAMVGLMVKDVLAAHVMLLACLIALRTTRRAACALAFAAAGVAIALRYQFAVILLPLAVWTAWLRAERTGRLVAGFGALLATLVIIQLGVAAGLTTVQMAATPRSIGTTDTERSLRKVMIYDIAGIVSGAPETPLDLFAEVGVDLADLRRRIAARYTPDHVDPLWLPDGPFAPLAVVPTRTVREQLLAAAMSSPGALLRHHLATFTRVLGTGDIWQCFPIVRGLYRLPADFAADLEVASYRPALSTGILGAATYPVEPLFRAIVYVIASLAFVTLHLARRAVPAVAGLALAGLLYEVTFILLPQACDVRYSYFLVVTTLFAGGTALFAPSRRNLVRAG